MRDRNKTAADRNKTAAAAAAEEDALNESS
jgi:hypothetical protein